MRRFAGAAYATRSSSSSRQTSCSWAWSSRTSIARSSERRTSSARGPFRRLSVPEAGVDAAVADWAGVELELIVAATDAVRDQHAKLQKGRGVRLTHVGAYVPDKDAALGPGGVAAFAETQPMGRLGTPEDIASVAVSLASELAGFVSGVVLPVDGGIEAMLAVPA